MKALLILSILVSTPALGSECYQNEEDPSSTITVNDLRVDPEAPEMVWKQGGEVLELGTASLGTGISRRYAYVMDDQSDEPRTFGYVFVDKALVLDYDVYRLGCR